MVVGQDGRQETNVDDAVQTIAMYAMTLLVVYCTAQERYVDVQQAGG